MGFVVDKVPLGQVFSEYFSFPCHFSFHRMLHTHHLSSGAGTIGQLVADVPSGLSVPPRPKKLKQKKIHVEFGCRLAYLTQISTNLTDVSARSYFFQATYRTEIWKQLCSPPDSFESSTVRCLWHLPFTAINNPNNSPLQPPFGTSSHVMKGRGWTGRVEWFGLTVVTATNWGILSDTNRNSYKIWMGSIFTSGFDSLVKVRWALDFVAGVLAGCNSMTRGDTLTRNPFTHSEG
jgi:hypothetical protein